MTPQRVEVPLGWFLDRFFAGADFLRAGLFGFDFALEERVAVAAPLGAVARSIKLIYFLSFTLHFYSAKTDTKDCTLTHKPIIATQ